LILARIPSGDISNDGGRLDLKKDEMIISMKGDLNLLCFFTSSWKNGKIWLFILFKEKFRMRQLCNGFNGRSKFKSY